MFPPDFIVADRIRARVALGSKKKVLEKLAELLAPEVAGIGKDKVFERLLERERLGSTGLGHGIALPHARIKEVQQPTGAFLQLIHGVDFDALDDKPVDLAFAMLVPEEATAEHLQLLARLASLFSNPQLCGALRNAASAEDILELIENSETLSTSA